MSSGRSLSGFDPKALASFDKTLGALSDNTMARGTIATVLDKQADILVTEMQTKVDQSERTGGSGRLKKSIRKEFGGNGTQVFVKAGGPLTTKPVKKGGTAYDYALAEEFGTAKEAARPFFYNTFRAAIPRIIAAAVFDMSKTLKEPEERLLAKHEFTGFEYDSED